MRVILSQEHIRVFLNICRGYTWLGAHADNVPIEQTLGIIRSTLPEADHNISVYGLNIKAVLATYLKS
jgi:hypothetical protein